MRAWSEWTDPEIDTVVSRMEGKSLHPMSPAELLVLGHRFPQAEKALREALEILLCSVRLR